MRNCKFFIVVFVVFFTCRIYAEDKVNIRIIQNNSISKTIEVDKNVTHLTFSGPEFETISSIAGLEKLENLKSLDFYNLTFSSMEFFNSCKNLKNIWIAGCTITSFSFIEEMVNLEEITLDFYIDYSMNELIKGKKIDLKNLKKLKRIYFLGLIIEENQITKYKTIPQFQNVPSGCTLIMQDQDIERWSDIDISILKQFKNVDLFANPVLKTKDINSIESILIKYE